MSGHTPGPWVVTRGAHAYPFSVEAEDRTVAYATTAKGDCDANARMIAAAPDMYAVLAEWVRLVDGGPMGTVSATEHLRRLHAAARAAIAKVEIAEHTPQHAGHVNETHGR